MSKRWLGWYIQQTTKIMSNIENILNDNNFLAGAVDTPKQGIENCRKREFSHHLTNQGTVYLLSSKNIDLRAQ